MRIETRMESTPVQKVIDPEQERSKIRKLTNDLESIRENNKALESAVVNNESVIVKIDDFLKEFDYESWKNKETKIEQLNFQIEQNHSQISELERSLKEVSDNKLLLQQVPCGSDFPSCKFIKHAHDSIAKEATLH